MRMVMFIAAAALCLFLLRAGWRLLVEIPNPRQAWVPDVVDDLLSRSLSALLMTGCAMLLYSMIEPLT
jgi:hypothetical protein